MNELTQDKEQSFNIHSHLSSRNLDTNIHRTLIDEKENTATFFSYNLSGQIVGYQQYRPLGNKYEYQHPKLGKYFTYRNRHIPTVALFGMESYNFTPDILFIVEGVFDAARLTSKGISCVATMSNNPPKDYKNFFSCLPRKTVVICDGDGAGIKLAKFGDIYEVVPKEFKDLGDAPDDYINFLIERYC